MCWQVKLPTLHGFVICRVRKSNSLWTFAMSAPFTSRNVGTSNYDLHRHRHSCDSLKYHIMLDFMSRSGGGRVATTDTLAGYELLWDGPSSCPSLHWHRDLLSHGHWPGRPEILRCNTADPRVARHAVNSGARWTKIRRHQNKLYANIERMVSTDTFCTLPSSHLGLGFPNGLFHSQSFVSPPHVPHARIYGEEHKSWHGCKMQHETHHPLHSKVSSLYPTAA
jgi:hypothetical protein